MMGNAIHDLRSLVGWGLGEDEEVDAILRVLAGLGDFYFDFL